MLNNTRGPFNICYSSSSSVTISLQTKNSFENNNKMRSSYLLCRRKFFWLRYVFFSLSCVFAGLLENSNAVFVLRFVRKIKFNCKIWASMRASERVSERKRARAGENGTKFGSLCVIQRKTWESWKQQMGFGRSHQQPPTTTTTTSKIKSFSIERRSVVSFLLLCLFSFQLVVCNIEDACRKI